MPACFASKARSTSSRTATSCTSVSRCNVESSTDHATRELIRMLQNAYSGELAAFYAYEGHWRSVSDPDERREIKQIGDEEIVHRNCVGELLAKLGAGPRPGRELMMKCIGLTIGFLCRIGGWLIPMYGAGKLESGNIV